MVQSVIWLWGCQESKGKGGLGSFYKGFVAGEASGPTSVAVLPNKDLEISPDAGDENTRKESQNQPKEPGPGA